MSQLALPIGLADHAVFSSFYPGGNAPAVAYLEAMASGSAGDGAWLRGAPGSGRSHLLQAVCAASGDAAVFLPSALLETAGPALLDGLETRRIVCIDDVDRLAGDAGWERALFVLFNDLQAQGGQLVASAPSAPRDCGFELADLVSRLAQLPLFALRSLDDEERLAALRLRAAHRGLDLPDDAARYLLARVRRDMGSLYGVLDALDREALRAQRRLTVPFVRDVLARID